jgi:hypothetical protein
MKLHIITVYCLLIFALSFGFVSCGPEEILPDAILTSLSIENARTEYIVVASRIPGPIANDSYVNYFDRDGYNYDYSTVSFNDEGAGYTEEMRIRVSLSEGARAEWGIGGRSTRPTAFYATGVPVDFNANDYIYIRVTSEDAYVVNYYRFYARIFSPVTEMADMIVAGRYASMPEPGDIPSEGENGQINITRSEAANALLAPATFDDNATVRYYQGIHPDNQDFSEPLDYQPLNYTWITDPKDSSKTIKNWLTRVPLQDDSWLYIEVTAQNTIEKLYYRFQVYTGRMTTISKLEFQGTGSVWYEAVGKGFPGYTWASVSPGGFESPHQTSSGFGIRIVLDDPEGTSQYAKIASINAAQPGNAAWQTPSNTPILFNNNEALAIRVIPDNDAGRAQYYRVKVGLVAIDFLEHPKAAVYNVGATAVPLKFTADRDLTGATYQWYEANSWYGGYGFDADGKILGEAGFTPDPSDPSGESEQKQYYVGHLDEKSNVSFHNGGNQFYRLPIPGRPIVGATSNEYTPPTDKRPFIGGFSNVTNYYWVVVTKDGLTATSHRAVIVTEHNEIWDLGVKTGPAVVKKHFIVDLPNLKDKPGAEGVRVPIKNVTAFSSFRQPFQIDLRGILPADFNIMEYSMATAWAKFYLRDGTPWIQNWTQGNISFVDWSENSSQDGDKEKIVLYYNLTNNNGTLGLQGDGKEPSGGSLDNKFTHVVVMPSGEKSIRSMPPLNANGTPDANDGDAQGWFCGFIELVELRFEGPTRVK